MPTLHLLDRPADLDHRLQSRQGLGATMSGASHAIAAALLILAFQGTKQASLVDEAAPFEAPPRVVWMPNVATGGGNTGGGERSIARSRPAARPGSDAASTPAAPTPSLDATNDVPLEPLPIVAQPIAGGTHMQIGQVFSDSTSDALGPGVGSGGDGDGPATGAGKGPRGVGIGPVPGGPGVTTPVIVHQVKPRYTAEAMRARLQGSVWLECVVLPDGTVGDTRILRSLDRVFGLDEEAIAAAKQWRFRPGLLEGRPVPVLVTLELAFSVR